MKLFLIVCALAVISIAAEESIEKDVSRAGTSSKSEERLSFSEADDPTTAPLAGDADLAQVLSTVDDDAITLADGTLESPNVAILADNSTKPPNVQPTKPLSLRKLQLEKTIRFPNLNEARKFVKLTENRVTSAKKTASKEFEKIYPDFEKKLEQRNREAISRLNRINDAEKRQQLESTLKEAVERARIAVTKFLAGEKTDLEATISYGDFVKTALKLIDDAQAKQTSVTQKLRSVGPKILSTLQSYFAEVESVMKNIP